MEEPAPVAPSAPVPPHQPQPGKSARWIFTCNNPGALTLASLWDPDSMLYLTGQKEKAPTTGTEHMHVYIVWKIRKAFMTVLAWAAKKFPNHPDVEIAKGNEQQCRDYVTKTDDRIDGPWEFGTYDGTRGISGKRTDLDDVYALAKAGKTFAQIAEAHPSDVIRYSSGIMTVMLECQPPPPISRPVRVITLWGPTSTGKTHRVLMTFPDVYQVIPGRDPWGNYKGEKEIIFDEFDPYQWTIQQMNMYLDKWRCKLNCRYHDRYARWETVFICSNDPPTQWFLQASSPLLRSLYRRLGLWDPINNVQVESPTVVNVLDQNQEVNLLALTATVPTGIPSPAPVAPVPAPAPTADSITPIVISSPSPSPPPLRRARHLEPADLL